MHFSFYSFNQTSYISYIIIMLSKYYSTFLLDLQFYICLYLFIILQTNKKIYKYIYMLIIFLECCLLILIVILFKNYLIFSFKYKKKIFLYSLLQYILCIHKHYHKLIFKLSLISIFIYLRDTINSLYIITIYKYIYFISNIFYLFFIILF